MTERDGISPAYRLESERLLLRCWTPTDAPEVRAALDRSDAHLRPWIPFMRDEPRSLEDTVTWLRARRASFDRDELYAYAIFARDGGRLVGETMLISRQEPGALEIGYWIDLESVGQGLAREAAAAMTRVAFELFEVGRVDICCGVDNRASAAIPPRIGFALDATLPGRGRDCEGEPYDLEVWSLTRDAYPASPARGFPLRAADAIGRELELGPAR